jgi:5-(carboxyamino)imidazole ribonucleotide mutase
LRRRRELDIFSPTETLISNMSKENTSIVGILMGSDSDWPTMKAAAEALKEFGIASEAKVISAHRDPHGLEEYVSGAPARGVKAFICGAGGAAHLAGAVAAHTIRPVIGIPVVSGSLGGLDSLLSTVQMPPGMPVATVAIGGAENAGLLAAQIIAVSDPELGKRVEAERAARRKKVLDSDAEVRGKSGT